MPEATNPEDSLFGSKREGRVPENTRPCHHDDIEPFLSVHDCIALAVTLYLHLAVKLFNIPALVEFIRI